MLIRPFEPADIPAAAAVLRRAAEAFILHESAPEHAAAFLAEHDAAGLRRNLDAGFVATHVLANTGIVVLEGGPAAGWDALTWEDAPVGYRGGSVRA